VRRLRRVSVPDRRIRVRVRLKISKDAILRFFYDSGTDCLLDLCDVVQTRKFTEEMCSRHKKKTSISLSEASHELGAHTPQLVA
jgi:hypothetical protein